jgi:hypothetical protein
MVQEQSTYQRGCGLSTEVNDVACLSPSYGSQSALIDSAMHDEAPGDL